MADNRVADFEEAFRKLKAVSEKMDSEGLKLEESVRLYEEGMEAYRLCRSILEEAKQKMDVYRETGDEEEL